MSHDIHARARSRRQRAVMSLNRLLITAVVIENRPVHEVAAAYGVSRSWVHRLLARYRREGDAVFEPLSRRPASNPNAISTEAVELIVELREKLTATGLDAGPDTIRWHLEHHHSTTVSRATIARYATSPGRCSPFLISTSFNAGPGSVARVENCQIVVDRRFSPGRTTTLG